MYGAVVRGLRRNRGIFRHFLFGYQIAGFFLGLSCSSLRNVGTIATLNNAVPIQPFGKERNIIEIAIWLVIIYAIVYEPIFGYFDFQKLKTRLKEIPNAKIKYYVNSIISLWTPTIFILLVVLFTEITFQEIGFTLPTVNTEPFGPVITYIALVVGLLYFLSILYMIIGYHTSAAFKEKLAQMLKKEQQHMAFSMILPTTKKEKRLWNFVSLTAGITEEIIYRGFLIFAFSYLFPNLSIWIVILFASTLFGLAHTYQGAAGVIRTTAIGVFFSILYLSLGSILPLIVFHFFIDYVGKLGDYGAEL